MFSSSGIAETKPSGTNQYDAGLGKIEQRFKKGFSILAGFTWSKLFEDTSFLGPQIAGVSRGAQTGWRRPAVPSDGVADLGYSGGPQGEIRLQHAEVGGCGHRRLGTGRQLQYSIGRAGGVQHRQLLLRQKLRAIADKQSLSKWFDTSCFYPFPSANTTDGATRELSCLDRRAELPGYNYVPTAGDTIKNGVYQDFANYMQTSPTRWGDVRASRVNNVDAGLRKNFRSSNG